MQAFNSSKACILAREVSTSRSDIFGFAIADTLAQREPGNAEWRRDLWVSHGRLGQFGQLALAEDNASLALTHFRAAERVMAALVEQWPDHRGFAADLETARQYIERIESAWAKIGFSYPRAG